MPTTLTPILVHTTRNVGPFWHIRVRRMVTGCDYVNFSSTRDETKATDLALKDACRRTEHSTLAGFRVVDVIPVTVVERMERVDHDMPHTDIIESAGGGGPIHPDDLHGAVRVDPATNHPDMLPHPSPEATVIATAHANLRHAVESVELSPPYDDSNTGDANAAAINEEIWSDDFAEQADAELADYMEARRQNNGVAPDSHLTSELIALRQSADAALRNHGVAPSYFTGERLRDLAEQLCSLGVITTEVFAMARDLSHDYPVLKIEGEMLLHDGWLWRHCNESWNAPIDGFMLHPAALYSATTAQMYLKSDRLLCGMVMSLHLQYL